MEVGSVTAVSDFFKLPREQQIKSEIIQQIIPDIFLQGSFLCCNINAHHVQREDYSFAEILKQSEPQHQTCHCKLIYGTCFQNASKRPIRCTAFLCHKQRPERLKHNDAWIRMFRYQQDLA